MCQSRPDYLCQLFGMCAEIDQISQIELVTQSLTAVDCIPLSIWDNALHEMANKYNSIGSVSLLTDYIWLKYKVSFSVYIHILIISLFYIGWDVWSCEFGV